MRKHFRKVLPTPETLFSNRFLRWLQKWGYGGERQMEVFTDMCRNRDVQRLTFESYMHKNMAPMPWLAQMRMTGDIIAAAYAGHGDTKHVLLLPEDPAECFDMGALAFDLSVLDDQGAVARGEPPPARRRRRARPCFPRSPST